MGLPGLITAPGVFNPALAGTIVLESFNIIELAACFYRLDIILFFSLLLIDCIVLLSLLYSPLLVAEIVTICIVRPVDVLFVKDSC